MSAKKTPYLKMCSEVQIFMVQLVDAGDAGQDEEWTLPVGGHNHTD